MAKRKTRVTKLTVNEVSLVDNPANPAARAVLAKRAEPVVDEGFEMEDEVEKNCDHSGMKKGEKCKKCGYVMKRADEEVEDDLLDDDDDVEKAAKLFGMSMVSENCYRYSSALGDSIRSIIDDPTVEDKAAMIEKTIGQFRDSILAYIDEGVSDADGDEGLDKRNSQETTQMAKENEKPTGEETSVLKGLSPEQASAVEALIAKAVGTVAERLTKAETEANTLKEEIAKRDRIAKAKALAGPAPVDAEKLADVLKAVSGNEEAEKFLADMLQKYAASMEAGKLLKEVGLSAGVEQVGNVEEVVEKKVEELRKSDSKLTYEQAYAKVILANPDLYEKVNQSAS